MYYADSIGLPRVVSKLEEFRAALGDAFRPAALLEDLASRGGKLAECG
jgi:3-hydroxyacyl-CoA dehydrogenase